jgi:quercetin dioxygenase-like cupin family protein
VCFHILTVLRGAGWLRSGDRPAQSVELRPGESLLVPAGMQEYEIGATDGRLVLVKAYVPDLVHDVVTPLQAAGIPDATIVQLGGDPRRSDLAPYAGR